MKKSCEYCLQPLPEEGAEEIEQRIKEKQELERNRLASEFEAREAQIKAEYEEKAEKRAEELVQLQLEPMRTQALADGLEKGRNENALENDRLRRMVEDLQRKLENKSSEARGTANEVEIKRLLEKSFSQDHFQSVKKGHRGGDIIQSVLVHSEEAGKILYEAKDVQKFDGDFIKKALDDRVRHGAAYAVIVTTAFPAKEKFFCNKGDVNIVHPEILPYVAGLLRQSLEQLKKNSLSETDKIAKTQLLYDYLRSQEFREKIGAAVAANAELQEILGKEEVYHENKWKNERLAQEKLAKILIQIPTHISAILEGKTDMPIMIPGMALTRKKARKHETQ